MRKTINIGHSGCKRKFIQLSRAWYADTCLNRKDIIDEITMGFYDHEGGTTGEFSIQWENWIGWGGKTAKLFAYDDSWDALWQFNDVIKQMAALVGPTPSPDDVCKILETCGVEDATPTVRNRK